MSALAIRTEHLAKQYRIGSNAAFRYQALRDTIADWMTFKRRTGGASPNGNYIWALDDVSLEVAQGDVLGVIGGNGAGKSTLLKILSRITRPTRGLAELYGRVGSLLEVGTGFHPELTGRENVYLNGAILGMRRTEIQRKFDAIVDFSGVSKFIDTPVRHYSSGMYVRLAFAVAAHLEPDILLVDEVLAVGDVAFQRQCIGKMQDVSRSGRTIIFVSHNMEAINRLCSRAVRLAGGRIVDDDVAEAVTARYLTSQLGTTARREWTGDTAPGNEAVRLRRVRVIDASRESVDAVDIRRPVGIEIVFEIVEQKYRFVPGVTLNSIEGTLIFIAMDSDPRWREPQPPGVYTSTAWIPGNLLNEGVINVTVSLGTFVAGGKAVRQAQAIDAVAFQVVDPGEGGSARGDYPGVWSAPVRPLLQWTLDR
jgi:lipopolysaccharide transport system ATP-binding protein